MGTPIPLLHSAITIMTPLLFAAMGGLFTERAGMLNIALEGQLLMGAFVGLVFTHLSGNLPIGILVAALCSMALAALMGALTIRLKANVFITGLATNLFATGITVALAHRFFATRGLIAPSAMPRLPTLAIPALARIPILADVLQEHTWYVYASWLLLLISWFCLYRTSFGFRLRACEAQEEALVSLGLKPSFYRFVAFLISGLCCGIGGSFLSLNIGVFVPNMSAGKGWIALVVIFLGNRHPAGLWIAALVFGLAEAFSNYAQGMFRIPADFTLALPYIFTLFVMVAGSALKKHSNRF
ncbi:MAG: ABC transporter permease [Treponema sp.]|jgi:simple sugar transport system permease protein|nr:ABC transporter permease [Treponema sp.]